MRHAYASVGPFWSHKFYAGPVALMVKNHPTFHFHVSLSIAARCAILRLGKLQFMLYEPVAAA